MSQPTTLRRRRDLAYACFVVPGAAAVLGSLGSVLPATLVEPAYVGFFVLMPLAAASVVALMAGTVLTFMVGRRDPVLVALLAATGLVVALMIAAYSDGAVMAIDGAVLDVLIAVYGLAALSIGIHWFAVRRSGAQ